MSLRQALIAVHANPDLDTEALPETRESLAVLEGLEQAIAAELVTVGPKKKYSLSETARLMVESPVRRVA